MIKYSFNPSVFFREDALSYYLLGCLYSDGSVSNKPRKRVFKLYSNDIDWVEDFRNAIESNHKIYQQKNHYSINYSLQISNGPVVEWLVSKGCVPNKSKILTYPTIPEEYHRDFIRGIFDGDGSVIAGMYARKNPSGKVYNFLKVQTYISTGSEQFANDLRKIFINLGLNPSINVQISGGNSIVGLKKTHTIPPGKVYKIYFNNFKAGQFLNWMYYNPKLITLKRKFVKSIEALSLLEVSKNNRKNTSCYTKLI